MDAPAIKNLIDLKTSFSFSKIAADKKNIKKQSPNPKKESGWSNVPKKLALKIPEKIADAKKAAAAAKTALEVFPAGYFNPPEAKLFIIQAPKSKKTNIAKNIFLSKKEAKFFSGKKVKGSKKEKA
ncbi:MAG: hypothetical protein WC322_04555 [Candidatus Paceibacterota bacterium]|jgi:hypothetical protein|nr:hypothetical protein [Candidatus Paceibacterota bacterium]MDD4831035.1 hypothetical protein [Candidatus Paceibacterota bacterium]MDD4875325.1 hypothetical protein [Candidatus Paceibacterota bacterium]